MATTDPADDNAPLVFDEDGNAMRVRVVGAECEGDVSGSGMFGYRDPDAANPTIFFEEADADDNNVRCCECGCDLEDPKNAGDPDVNGEWVCRSLLCRHAHQAEMECSLEEVAPW